MGICTVRWRPGGAGKAGRENCRRVCPLPERQKVSCLIYGALNEKAPKVHFKLRFDSSGVQLRAAVPLQALTSSTCSCSLSLSLSASGQTQLKRRRGMALTWPTVCFAFHCIWLPPGTVTYAAIGFDLMP